jgi:replicative superfamily II helicase
MNDYVEDVKEAHGYDELRKTQNQAIEQGLLNNSNNLLIAETGNGKTLCAEIYIRKRLEETEEKVVYCVPSRQLVRDKVNELSEWCSDVNSNSIDSRVNIMTFESVYNHLIRGSLEEVGLIVLDDFHEIYSSYRGVGIEKVITLSKERNIDIFSMSATIGNPEEIASWMDANLIISEESRGIEIKEEFIEYDGNKSEWISYFIRDNTDKAPFLIFNSSRSNSIARAREVSDNCDFESDVNHKKKIEEIMGDDMTDKLYDLSEYMSNGVAFHHAGLPSEIKNYIESCFQNGEIEVISSTTTIAYGFDSPVQTVIVGDISRYNPDKGYMDYVNVWEYLQWIGRAARPGNGFEKGYSFTVCNNENKVKEKFLKENRELEPVPSHLEIDSEFRKFILELVSFGWKSPDDIKNVIEESFYAEKITGGESWGDFMDTSQEKLIESNMKTTIEWLESNELLSKRHSSGEFLVTDKGQGAVSFILDNFIQCDISQIIKLYRWIEREEVTKESLVYNICSIFDISLGISDIDSPGKILSNYKTVDEYTITSYIILERWCENESLDDITYDLNEDLSFLPSTARKLSNLIKASSYLFDAIDIETEPSWLDDLSLRIKYGVKNDQVIIVNNVEGIGRRRVNNLAQYTSSVSTSNGISYDGMIEGLIKLSDEFGWNEMSDILSNNVDGIGDNISDNIMDFLNDYQSTS